MQDFELDDGCHGPLFAEWTNILMQRLAFRPALAFQDDVARHASEQVYGQNLMDPENLDEV
jgi:hypothetical protein